MLGFLDELATPALETGVCIIGGGPAGITLALDLAGQGIEVVLCEAGGLKFDPQSQMCYAGEVVGDEYHYLDVARLRWLGGTSNHWTGVCANMNDFDFAPKPAAPQTGWPIGPSVLRPYENRARAMLGLTPTQTPVPVLDGAFFRLDVRRADPVIRFGEYYHDNLATSPAIRTVLNANLVGMEADGGRITAMQFRSYEDRPLTVRARCFVLSCGAIENARLLLHLNAARGTGFGAEGGALGRYFTEHPHGLVGEYVLFDNRPFNFDTIEGDATVSGMAHFQPSQALIDSGETLNFRIKLENYRSADARGVVQDLMCAAPAMGRPLAKAMGKDLVCVGRIGSVSEQEPRADNRVELGGADLDRFGIPRPVLYWRRSELDRQTMSIVATRFAAAVAEADVGRVKLMDWVTDFSLPVESNEALTGFHHIGTTRMAAEASGGVVDTDCRVFGTDNLYVAGSSVFPSCGHANPTAPLLGMALRLSEHLQQRLL